MECRFRTFALLIAAMVLATGAGRTAHMLFDHADGGSCPGHVHPENGHEHGGHGEIPSQDDDPSDGDHGDDPSCDLCTLISSIASPDAGDMPALSSVEGPVCVLVTPTQRAVRTVDRSTRMTRGPPARG